MWFIRVGDLGYELSIARRDGVWVIVRGECSLMRLLCNERGVEGREHGRRTRC